MLDKTKIPPALEPQRVQQVFGDELEFMRQLVRDMPAEFPPLREISHRSRRDHRQASGAEAPPAPDPEIQQLREQWDQLEDRGEKLNHEAIRAAALQIREGSSNRVRMILFGGHRFHRGWYVGKKSPTLDNPVVTKIMGTRHPRILYQEVVEAADGKIRSFDLIIESDYLIEASEQITPEPADASLPTPK